MEKGLLPNILRENKAEKKKKQEKTKKILRNIAQKIEGTRRYLKHFE